MEVFSVGGWMLDVGKLGIAWQFLLLDAGC
jgi:hypothetical protein